MSYQQPYDQHRANAPQYADPVKAQGPAPGGNGTAAGQALQTRAPYQDKWWAVAFIAQLLALVIIGGICYNRWHTTFQANQDPNATTTDGNNNSNDLGPLEHAFPLIAISIAVAVLQAGVWLWLMQHHGRILIWITLIFGLIVSAAGVVLAARAGSVVGAVLAGIFFLLNLWYVYSVRHKIPFAAAMMDVSLRSMSRFKSAWLLPIWGMILMSGLAFVWSVCAFSIVYAVDNGSSSNAYSVRGLIFFVLALSLFWTILAIKAWVHVCVAGVQATWYFLAPHAVPNHPVFHAVKRASTTSFGSICFGSFIVAFIRTVRFFVNLAYQNARNSNNQFAACALCILECLIGILESIVNYLNQYAFAICAIYGKAFMPAARDAWGLMKSRGFDAVINDSLIGGVLAFAQIIGGIFTGVVVALVAYYAFDIDWRAYAGLGFVIGVMLMVVITEVVESAIIALFICLADDPVTLQRTKPDEYNRLMDPLNENYPQRGQPHGGVV